MKMIVKEGFKELVGKDTITIDKEVMDDLELIPGDVIQIIHPKTKKLTAAIIDPDVLNILHVMIKDMELLN